MRKITMVGAAVIVVGLGVWAMTTNLRVDASTAEAIYPLQLMKNANNPPASHYVDYSLIFN
jgi:hypothetical protein